MKPNKVRETCYQISIKEPHSKIRCDSCFADSQMPPQEGFEGNMDDSNSTRTVSFFSTAASESLSIISRFQLRLDCDLCPCSTELYNDAQLQAVLTAAMQKMYSLFMIKDGVPFATFDNN